MHDNALAGLDLGRYARWLRRMTGSAGAVAVCGAEGDLLWHDGEPIAELCTQRLKAQQFAWPCDGRGMQRHDCGDGSLLFYIPLYSGADQLLGHFAVLSDIAVPAASLDTMAEVMEDLAAAIGDEYRMTYELNAMAEELSERYEELHLVYAIDQKLSTIKEGENVFAHLLKSCAEHIDVDVAAFIRPGRNLCVSHTNLSQPIHNLDLVLVEMRGDLFRFVHASRTTLVLNDRADPKRAYVFTDMPFKVMCCPVFENGAVIAILVLLNHDHKPPFTNSDRRLGEILANQLSGLSRLYGMLDETGKFNEQMAAALIESVEAKDPYTRGHSERVHHISMEIGRALALSDAELDDLYWGALLHDVGKIGIPDAILCKPARLTRDEYTFIMVHPERSYEILRHIDRFEGAVPGARHHQEKFDGTGYPHGLRGTAIPLNARIIAVADTYDSITSSRAYRAGRSHEVAIREMQRVAGLQLDPQIVAVFMKICETEPEWMQRFAIRREPELQTEQHVVS
jgi:HD-GYP domain-containing protein (c-di-GMP phosphodiesterase class II)